MKKLFSFRFKDEAFRGVDFGDIYLTAMNEMFESPSVGIKKSTEVLNITGQVMPATLDRLTICAELKDGTLVEGREKIPQVTYDKVTEIQRIYISPSNCVAAPGVVEAISEADAIIIGPGSLYTDVLPNLLVKKYFKNYKRK